MKIIVIIMFFFMLTSCEENYIEINQITKTILQEDIEKFSFEIKTNIEDLKLIKIDNNENFEYSLLPNEKGYQLDLIIYNPVTFANLIFKSDHKEYICNIGEITIITNQYNTYNALNLILDDNNQLYIYNKLNDSIIIKEIEVYGGYFIPSIKYNDLVSNNLLTLLGNIYNDQEEMVLYIKYLYEGINYEEVFEIK